MDFNIFKPFADYGVLGLMVGFFIWQSFKQGDKVLKALDNNTEALARMTTTIQKCEGRPL